MDTLKTKVLKAVRERRMIAPGEKVVLGVSGGPDSMALLYLLYELRDDLGCALHIAHLDHMLRGAESKGDAVYVKEHAQKLRLPITVEAVDVQENIVSKESLESGARRIRYEFYERVLRSVQADRVALGHNADDQAETVLMRLLRGSGAQGLGGIPAVRDNKFVRPLIEISRSEIEEYLQQVKLTPRQDSSNLSTGCRRNKVRLELMPVLEREYSSNIKQILRRTGDILQAEDDLLKDLASKAADSCMQSPDARTITVRVSDFRGYHLALQRRILRLAIRTLVGNLAGFDYGHIGDLLNLSLYGVTGSVASLPQAVYAEKTYDQLVLRHGYHPGMASQTFDYCVDVPGVTEIPDPAMRIETTVLGRACGEGMRPRRDGDRFREAFDRDKICGHLHLRNRRPGDRFQPLGMLGRKKLKDFLIDEKVPRAVRDDIPILTDGNKVLWVVGYRIDDRFKVTADTRNQLIVTATPGQTSR